MARGRPLLPPRAGRPGPGRPGPRAGRQGPRLRLRLPPLKIPPILPVMRFSPALLDIPIEPTRRAAGVLLLSRYGRPTGRCVDCGARVCPICGVSLGSREMQLYGLRWIEGSEHFVQGHGMWTPGMELMLKRARFYAPLPGVIDPPRRGLNVNLRLPNGRGNVQASLPVGRRQGPVRAQAQVNLGSVGPPPPPPSGPFLTIPAIQGWVVWLFQVKAHQTDDATLKGKLDLAARMIGAQQFRNTWEPYEAGIVEAVRLQSQPMTGNIVLGINSMAEQSLMPGWMKTPEFSPLPSVRYFRTRIAMFLVLFGDKSQNPDLFTTPSLSTKFLEVARGLVNGDAWSLDKSSIQLTEQLIQGVMNGLPKEAEKTVMWLENMLAIVRGVRPRTWEEILRQQYGITLKAAGSAAAGAAAAAGTVLAKVDEGLDAAQDGLSTKVVVGVGLAVLVVGAGMAVAARR